MPRDPIGIAPEERFRIGMDGITIDVPSGWEARMKRAASEVGAETFTVAHAATVPLPTERGDYGSNVVERLGAEDAFVSLVEFGPEAANTALFKEVEVPPSRFSADDFHPRQLQRLLPGQGGVQRFFTYRGRAFCLYVVLGSFALRAVLLEAIHRLLDSMSIEGRE